MNIAYRRTSDAHAAVACYVRWAEALVEERRTPLMLAAAEALSAAMSQEDARRAERTVQRPPRPSQEDAKRAERTVQLPPRPTRPCPPCPEARFAVPQVA